MWKPATLGGEHCTARRSRIVDDADFIWAKLAAGVPESAIARMIGRPLSDVRLVTRPSGLEAVERAPKPAPVKDAPAWTPKKLKGRKKFKATGPKAWQRNVSRNMPAVVRDYVRAIAAEYGLTLAEIVGPSRKKHIAHARQDAFDALYSTGRYSLPMIGSWFGGRDHTTVLHGVRQHEKRRLAAQQLAEAA